MNKILIFFICCSFGLFCFSSCNLINKQQEEEPVNRLKPEDVDDYDIADKDEDEVFFDEEDMESLPEEVGEQKEGKNQKQAAKKKPVNDVLDDEFTEKSGVRDEILVVTGSYSVKENAQTMVDKLKTLGYKGAQVVIFREKEFHSVIAGTYTDPVKAQQVVAALKKEQGINAYLHKKRYGKDQ